MILFIVSLEIRMLKYNSIYYLVWHGKTNAVRQASTDNNSLTIANMKYVGTAILDRCLVSSFQ